MKVKEEVSEEGEAVIEPKETEKNSLKEDLINSIDQSLKVDNRMRRMIRQGRMLQRVLTRSICKETGGTEKKSLLR